MVLNLQNLPSGQPITTPDGQPTLAFTVYWQQLLEAVEEAFNGLANTVAAIAAAQAAADAANAAAATAEAAAATAQTTATNISSAAAIQSSYVSTLALSAADAGTDVTITVPAHTRFYPQSDGTTTSVAVAGGTITGQAYSTGYYVYYDQPSRAGGTVTYLATTSAVTAAQIGDRHVVGSIYTPAAAAVATSGGGTQPPGSSSNSLPEP